MFEARLDANLAALAEALRTGTYRPQPIRDTGSERPRERAPSVIPTVRDRVVQTACACAGTIFDGPLPSTGYGFRPRRGAKDALRQVATLFTCGISVRSWMRISGVLRPHSALRRCRARVASKVSDTRVLTLVDAFLQQPIFDGLTQWTVDDGTPQARDQSVVANVYLDRSTR